MQHFIIRNYSRDKFVDCARLEIKQLDIRDSLLSNVDICYKVLDFFINLLILVL